MNTYSVAPVDNSTGILDCGWQDGPWGSADELLLTHHMGEPPTHRPEVKVKLLYDSKFLYVFFHVMDRYVLATAKNHQDSVCIDSCVEFFFTPGGDVNSGYFNIEINCGGTVLLNHQLKRGEKCRKVDAGVIERMSVRPTLPHLIDPEVADPTEWSLAYRVSFSDLADYAKITQPGPGVLWRANFYKCADHSSHPHWLTWAPVDRPAPDFHQSGFFGDIIFSD